jgi:hypothetical protein
MASNFLPKRLAAFSFGGTLGTQAYTVPAGKGLIVKSVTASYPTGANTINVVLKIGATTVYSFSIGVSTKEATVNIILSAGEVLTVEGSSGGSTGYVTVGGVEFTI